MKSWLLALSLCLASGSSIRAAIDEASDLDPATQLQRANDAISADQAALKDARADAKDIEQGIAEDQSHIQQINARLAGGARDLPHIESDLQLARAKLEARKSAFEPSRLEYEAAQAKLDAARQKAMSDFESAPDFHAAMDAAGRAQSNLDAAERTALSDLSKSSAYRSLKATVDANQAREDYFHQAGPAFFRDQQVFHDRKTEATTKLNQLKERYLQAVPDVQQARAATDSANAALATVRAKYEGQLGNVPEVSAAQQALAEKRGPYEQGVAAIRDGEARVAPIQTAYDRTKRGMAADKAELAEIQDDLADGRAELSRVNADIERLSADLTNALAAVEQAQHAKEWGAVSNATSPLALSAGPLDISPMPALLPPPTFVPAPDSQVSSALAFSQQPAPIFVEPSYFFAVVGNRSGFGHFHHLYHISPLQTGLSRLNGLDTQSSGNTVFLAHPTGRPGRRNILISGENFPPILSQHTPSMPGSIQIVPTSPPFAVPTSHAGSRFSSRSAEESSAQPSPASDGPASENSRPAAANRAGAMRPSHR